MRTYTPLPSTAEMERAFYAVLEAIRLDMLANPRHSQPATLLLAHHVICRMRDQQRNCVTFSYDEGDRMIVTLGRGRPDFVAGPVVPGIEMMIVAIQALMRYGIFCAPREADLEDMHPGSTEHWMNDADAIPGQTFSESTALHWVLDPTVAEYCLVRIRQSILIELDEQQTHFRVKQTGPRFPQISERVEKQLRTLIAETVG